MAKSRLITVCEFTFDVLAIGAVYFDKDDTSVYVYVGNHEFEVECKDSAEAMSVYARVMAQWREVVDASL